jgi:hypothetical protein
MKHGDLIPVPCPDCEGQLTADHQFEQITQAIGNPQERQEFWSTRCDGCSGRFNYTPATQVLHWIRG